MLQNIAQVQSAPISELKLTHFVGLMTFTRDQYNAFFLQDNPAPTKVATQFARFLTRYTALDEAYNTDSYSLDTAEAKEADQKCDRLFMGAKKMAQAQTTFDFNPGVKQAALRMMQAIDKYDIDVAEDYLGENNKLQQFLHDVDISSQLTADAETLGLTSVLAQLAEQVALLRDILTQRGVAKAPKGAMKAARAQMEVEYRWLIAILNAAALMDENEHRFDTLFLILNQNIDYLKNTVLARQGGGSSSSNSGNGQNGQSGEDNGSGSENGGGSEQGGSGSEQGGSEQGGGLPPSGGGEVEDDNGGSSENGGGDNGGGLPPSGGGEVGDNSGGGGGGLPGSGGEG